MTAEQLYALANQELGRMQALQALRFFDLAEKAGYDSDGCAAGRWSCHMLLGGFEDAWRESDAIAARAKPDPHRFWDGEPIDGRNVLLRCLHGLGDTIQFIRYAPLIRQRACSFSVEAQPSLKALLSAAHVADTVFTWEEPEPLWDQQIEVVELPRVFRTTLETIPNRVPYLDVPGEPAMPARADARPLHAGFVWTAGDYNPARSIALERFAALFSTPGVTFHSLQAGVERGELEPWQDRVINRAEDWMGVLPTAKALKRLDLLITVDSMPAHLAGALACPVWTLLPFECDWRWMLGRDDSPWYPTMRLFRQPNPGDWDSVLARVQCELSGLAEEFYLNRPRREA